MLVPVVTAAAVLYVYFSEIISYERVIVLLHTVVVVVYV